MIKNKLHILRWLLSASSFILFVISIRAAFKMEALEAAPYVIFALICLIAAILLLIPETVKPTTRYLSGIITSIIIPDHKFSKPSLSYALARRYIEQSRYDDAIQEYGKIIHYYPGEIEAYLGMISASSLAGETQLAEKYKKQLKKRTANMVSVDVDADEEARPR